MQVELMNMCMIYDKSNNKVLVQDKPIKEGWEGLTFPGGHVEADESIYNSVIREVREETGLDVEELKLVGFAHWIDEKKSRKQVGVLFKTSTFKGKLLDKTQEGPNMWIDLDEFVKMDGKSWSMNEILDVYLKDDLTEAMASFTDNGLSPFDFY